MGGHARFTRVTSIEEGVPAAPRHWEADVLLRDGRTAHIRPIEPSDAELLVEFYDRVSDESKYYRFFSPMPKLSEKDILRSPGSTTSTGSRSSCCSAAG